MVVHDLCQMGGTDMAIAQTTMPTWMALTIAHTPFPTWMALASSISTLVGIGCWLDIPYNTYGWCGWLASGCSGQGPRMEMLYSQSMSITEQLQIVWSCEHNTCYACCLVASNSLILRQVCQKEHADMTIKEKQLRQTTSYC